MKAEIVDRSFIIASSLVCATARGATRGTAGPHEIKPRGTDHTAVSIILRTAACSPAPHHCAASIRARTERESALHRPCGDANRNALFLAALTRIQCFRSAAGKPAARKQSSTQGGELTLVNGVQGGNGVKALPVAQHSDGLDPGRV